MSSRKQISAVVFESCGQTDTHRHTQLPNDLHIHVFKSNQIKSSSFVSVACIARLHSAEN